MITPRLFLRPILFKVTPQFAPLVFNLFVLWIQVVARVKMHDGIPRSASTKSNLEDLEEP